jgi:hypothetical protein
MRYAAFVSLALVFSLVDGIAPARDQGDAAPGLPAARPTPLAAAEEQGPAPARLARRFNPAMALPIRDVWPVEVHYAFADGASVIARVDGQASETVAIANQAVASTDWSLPRTAADGSPIRYYVDAPGDDCPRTPGGLSDWRLRFRELAQPAGDAAPPTASPFPPTQYAHLYWWDRAAGLLAVQYWFYYPFNEWVNNHEGDWEHIQVILQGPKTLDETTAAAFAPVAHQYFFHKFQSVPRDVVRFAGVEPGDDHALVYVGGAGDILGYGGPFSGGSYPRPARYPGAAFYVPAGLSPAEDTSRPARFLAAADFKIVVLPEPDRIPAARAAELGWLRGQVYFGQRSVHRNPPLLGYFGGDRPPLQPAARDEWLRPSSLRRWDHGIEAGVAPPDAFPWPTAWAALAAAAPGRAP